MKQEISKSTIDLCDRCNHVIKVEGYGQAFKRCRYIEAGSALDFPVQKCSEFEPRGTLSKYEMEQMAIYIEKKKDSPGFRFTKHVNGGQIELK